MKRVVILGGGISGLAAAYRLTRAAPDLSVTLIEGDSRLGGKIVTERLDGFVIEGGPDSFLSLKPRGVGLCQVLGLEERLRGPDPKFRRTYVVRGRRLHELPEGLTGLIPTRLWPLARSGLISPLGKLRMALDYVLPPKTANGDESLAAFVERRLGRELYDRLIEPLMGGIYAGDGEQLSLAATFPQLRRAEIDFGGLIKGVLAQRANQSPAATYARRWPAFVTPAAGLAELVEALERELGRVDIRLGQRATRLMAAPGGYTVELASGERLDARAIILATPAFVTAELISEIDSTAAAALCAIPYVSTVTVSVAYPQADIPRPLDGYGYIIPRAENLPVLACTWTSTKFPDRAPAGYALIRAFIGRAGQEQALAGTDDDLLELARAELRRTLCITAAPVLHRIFRWPKAMPQYTLGHLSRVVTIEQRLAEQPGLFVAGSAYRGIGLPDCIQSGEQAAEAAVKFLLEAEQDTDRFPAGILK